MTTPYRDDARRRMTETALDVAAEEVVAHGWRGLQMRTVAARVGVSRQTLYACFGDKHGLSQALVVRHAERVLDELARATAEHADLRDQWVAVVRATLAAAEGDPMVKAALLSDSSTEFLPLLTSRGAPVLDLARDRLVDLVAARHPDLDRDRLAAAADAATRLTLSHLVLPRRPIDVVADEIGTMVARWLRG